MNVIVEGMIWLAGTSLVFATVIVLTVEGIKALLRTIFGGKDDQMAN